MTAVILLVVFAIFSAAAGCVIIPATPKATRSGDVVEPGAAVAVIYSRDASPQTPKGLDLEVVACVASAVKAQHPDVRLISQAEFHDAVFPGLVPAQVQLGHQSLELLFRTPEFRERIDRLGVRRVIVVGGVSPVPLLGGPRSAGTGAGWRSGTGISPPA